MTVIQESPAPLLQHFVGGRAVPSLTQQTLPVTNPSNGKTIARVPLGTREDVHNAVQVAHQAQRAWGNTAVKDRVQIMYRLKSLIEDEMESLAQLVTQENGKTLAESRGEIQRGLECIEFAASLPQIAAGQALEVGRGVECKMVRYPLGVVAAITPFNFPLMVPLWMIPTAIACGNAIILKPSEQTPLSAIRLGELFKQVGLPDGIYSVVHGGQHVVEAICDDPQIQAVGFVGSTKVARLVYERGTKTRKRVKALGGAKNHLIVMPDADFEMTVANVIASSTGCAGQRCMAASVLLAVDGSEPILEEIKKRFASMKAGRDIGALISAEAKARITGYIERCESQGVQLAVDGRSAIDETASPEGYYLGPTLFDHATPDDEVCCDEIFGPTLSVIRVKNLDEALAIENANPYGNAAAIYTSSGEVATYFSERASAGMIGINIGVPVPREPFPFGGWNESSFGEGDLTGHGSFHFWTKTKKITTKWRDQNRSNWMS
jgi:malonate-semialdehyde dehydrogenase (acetylating)/methylmalonate-semialdehyde dehydrogenase